MVHRVDNIYIFDPVNEDGDIVKFRSLLSKTGMEYIEHTSTVEHVFIITERQEGKMSFMDKEV